MLKTVFILFKLDNFSLKFEENFEPNAEIRFSDEVDPWLVVRQTDNIESNLFKLKKNNIIKFGKVAFNVREIVFKNDKNLENIKTKTLEICKKKDNFNHKVLSNTVNPLMNSFAISFNSEILEEKKKK